jgi:predicted nucleotidyltransferase
MQPDSRLSSEAMATYRRAFHQRSQAQLKIREKRRQQATDAARAAIAVVMPCYPMVQRAYLFGSILKSGGFGPNSDIDIAVEGANTALCFDIWRDLEQSAPEWQFDVRPLAEKDLFSERIRRKGNIVYERTTTT